MQNVNIFLSYCWKDSEIADDIFAYFKDKKNIILHRDSIDIGSWKSIKEYMQSINNMDYAILLISDSYLKSVNCMYEVLEVMRDRKYTEKVFPIVVNPEIYSPFSRIEYVKYWEGQFKSFSEKINEVEVQNQGPLNRDLKRYQDIASTIAEFLDVVADMNNPHVSDVKKRIEEKLIEVGAVETAKKQSENLFEQLGISQSRFTGEPTDLEINQFIKESYEQIINLLSKLSEQCISRYGNIQAQVEKVDNRTTIFRFYREGSLVRGLKVFLGSMYSSRDSIGISDATMYYGGNNNSWNGLYEAKVVDGELKLCVGLLGWNRDRAMNCQEVVADIWKNYIELYLER